MTEYDFDDDAYVIYEQETDKSNPRLEPVIELRIAESENKQKRVSIWEITNPGDVYLFGIQSWSRSSSYEQLTKDKEITISGSDADAFRKLITQFEEVEDVDSPIPLLTGHDPDLAEMLSQLIDHVENADTVDKEKLITKMIRGISDFGDEISDFDTYSDIIDEDQILRAEGMIQHARIRSGVSELERLVEQECKSESVKENAFQEHFDDHLWFFGNRYIGEIDRHLLGTKEVDFALKSLNGYLDIIELKRPHHDVVRSLKNQDHYYSSSTLNKAVAQVQYYMRQSQKKETIILDEYDVRAVKPRGTVVIGSGLDEEEREGLHIISSHLKNVEIVTYSDLIQRGHQMLQFYQNIPNDDDTEQDC
jgi:hypothetical protein